MGAVKGIFRFIVGGIFGLLSGIALAPAIAAFSDGNGNNAWVVFVVMAIGALLGVFAPTIRRSFGRGFLLLGASVFALPLSTMLLSGRVMNEVVTESTNQGAAVVGAGLAATMMTGAAAFIGFFLGAIFIIIGLVLALGGRREVYIVERASPGGRAPANQVPLAAIDTSKWPKKDREEHERQLRLQAQQPQIGRIEPEL